MSMPRLLVMTAVPFSLARLQANFNTINCADSSKNQPNLKRMNASAKQTGAVDAANSRLMKKRNRILKNRMSSQVSREKAKIRKELLEKQLLELQIEQMKIRLINNDLEMKMFKLEKENASLKRRIGECVDIPQANQNENIVAETLRHASLVNASLQKKWVLSHLFSLLIAVLGDFMSSFQVQNVMSSVASKVHQNVLKISKQIIPIHCLR